MVPNHVPLTQVSIKVPAFEGETIRRALISPAAEYLAVLPENGGARIYALHKGGLDSPFYQARNHKRSGDVPLVPDRFEVRHGFEQPAAAVAFRSKVAGLNCSEMALAFGRESRAVERVDLRTGERLPQLFMPRAQCVAYSPSGRFLATGSGDGSVRVYDLQGDAPKEVMYASNFKGMVTSVLITPGCDYVFAATGSGKCFWMRISTGVGCEYPLQKVDSGSWDTPVYAMAADPDPDDINVAFAGGSGTVAIVDIMSGRGMFAKTGLGGYVQKVQFDERRNELVMLGANGVECWELSQLTVARKIPNPGDGRYIDALQESDMLYLARDCFTL